MKTNVCVYIGPDDEPTALLEDVERPFMHVNPERAIVNIWRDPETNELHVSVHAVERVLLSTDCDFWEANGDPNGYGESWMILHPGAKEAFTS